MFGTRALQLETFNLQFDTCVRQPGAVTRLTVYHRRQIWSGGTSHGHRSSSAVELWDPDMDIGALSLSSPVTLQLSSPPIGRRTLIKYQTRPSGSSLIMATQLSTIWDPSYVNTLTAITSSYYFGTAIPEQAHPWT